MEVHFDQYVLDYLGRIKFLRVEIPYRTGHRTAVGPGAVQQYRLRARDARDASPGGAATAVGCH